MLRQLTVSLVILYFSLFAVLGQGLKTISGTVKQKPHHEYLPLAGAVIATPNGGIAVLSNEQGQFTITIPDALNEDTLEVSYIGFGTRVFNTNAINPVVITLLAIDEKRGETLSALTDPTEVIQKAIKKINKNYPARNTITEGCYMQALYKENSRIECLKADVKVYKAGYFKEDNTQLQLLSATTCKDTTPTFRPNVSQQFLFNDISIDKSTKPFLFDQYELYDFHLSGVIKYKDSLIYKYKFAPKIGVKSHPLYSGTFMIDLKTLAFTQFDYNVDYGYKNTTELSQMLNYTGYKLNSFYLKEHVFVEYRQQLEQWVINQAMLSGSYLLMTKDKTIKNNYSDTHKLIASVTTINPKKHSSPSLVNFEKPFANQVKSEYAALDSSFNVYKPIDDIDTKGLQCKVADVILPPPPITPVVQHTDSSSSLPSTPATIVDTTSMVKPDTISAPALISMPDTTKAEMPTDIKADTLSVLPSKDEPSPQIIEEKQATTVTTDEVTPVQPVLPATTTDTLQIKPSTKLEEELKSIDALLDSLKIEAPIQK